MAGDYDIRFLKFDIVNVAFGGFHAPPPQ